VVSSLQIFDENVLFTFLSSEISWYYFSINCVENMNVKLPPCLIKHHAVTHGE
jgi:hypothetical protein